MNPIANQSNPVQEPQLTPDLALNVITSAIRQLQLKYEDHVYIDKCINLLKEEIENKKTVITKTPTIVKKV